MVCDPVIDRFRSCANKAQPERVLREARLRRAQVSAKILIWKQQSAGRNAVNLPVTLQP
jgi:hypothetical protein